MPISNRVRGRVRRGNGVQGGDRGAITGTNFQALSNVPTDYVAFQSDEAMKAEKDRIDNAIKEMRRFNRLAPTVTAFYEELEQVWKNILEIKKAYMRSEVAKEKATKQLQVLGARFDMLVEKITGQSQKAMSAIDQQRAEYQARLNGGGNETRQPVHFPQRQRTY